MIQFDFEILGCLIFEPVKLPKVGDLPHAGHAFELLPLTSSENHIFIFSGKKVQYLVQGSSSMFKYVQDKIRSTLSNHQFLLILDIKIFYIATLQADSPMFDSPILLRGRDQGRFHDRGFHLSVVAVQQRLERRRSTKQTFQRRHAVTDQRHGTVQFTEDFFGRVFFLRVSWKFHVTGCFTHWKKNYEAKKKLLCFEHQHFLV